MPIPTELEYALELDRADPLDRFRERFVFGEAEQVYLDGNSLGRLPREAVRLSRELVEQQWGHQLIESWNGGWWDLPERIGGKIAGLLGAADDEVTVADSTSVNLFKLVVAALRARPERRKIVTDDLNFPSDLYVLRAALDLVGGGELEVVTSPDGVSVPEARLATALDEHTALLALSHTAFKSAFVYDMRSVTALAHRVGALALWDLSHSAGAVPVELNAAGADLAVGCCYKYLCGGPGAPAFLFVRSGLQEGLRNPIAGWFGQRDPFRFELEHRPLPGIRQFLTGTPPVVSLALIEPGVDLLLEAGMTPVREKSARQTRYLIDLWEAKLRPLGFELCSPREGRRRGSHVSLGHPEGYRINRALIERMRVVPDFRQPDQIRLGVCPLYTSFAELHRAAAALAEVVRERIYQEYSTERAVVT